MLEKTWSSNITGNKSQQQQVWKQLTYVILINDLQNFVTKAEFFYQHENIWDFSCHLIKSVISCFLSYIGPIFDINIWPVDH